MEKALNGFVKGMNRDSSPNKYDSNNYYEAINMRLTNNDNLNNADLSLIDGNVFKSMLPEESELMGYCFIRKDIILFIRRSNGTGGIYRFTDNNTNNVQALELIYEHEDLIFYEGFPIRAIGFYEREHIQKVYFSDGTNFFYHLNVANNEIGKVTPNEMQLVSEVTFGNIVGSVIDGGRLKAGRVAHAYQLYNRNGAETVFSPASRLLSITDSSESTQNGINYIGSKEGDICSKSVSLKIDIKSGEFDRIRVIAIEYLDRDNAANIRIVGEYSVGDTSNISIIDTGTAIGELTLEEFAFIQNSIMPKSLELKDNMLVAANVREEYFQVSDSYDTRAFRFNNSRSAVVYDTDDSPFAINQALTSVPSLKHECFNRFNDFDYDDSHQYKFKSDGKTLGGTGKYISYEFTNEDAAISTVLENDLKFFELYPLIRINSLNPFENYKNPSTVVGYCRDEIYRFGIVFFDKSGRPSFSKWIGDIRFPDDDFSTFHSYTVPQAMGGATYTKILGIKFTVDLTSDDTARELANQISGYQIVRCERTDIDKTILTQGAIGPMRWSDKWGLYNHPSIIQSIRYIKGYDFYNAVGSDNFIPTSDIGTILYVNKLSGTVFEFISPEYSLTKKLNGINSAFIEITRVITGTNKSWIVTKVDEDGAGQNTITKYFGDSVNVAVTAKSKRRRKIETNVLFEFNPNTVDTENLNQQSSMSALNSEILITNTVSTYHDSANGTRRYGDRGSYIALKVEEAFDVPLFTETTYDAKWSMENTQSLISGPLAIANIRVNRSRSIYGGTSYYARKNNTYHNASDFVSTNSVDVFGGDTFTCGFFNLRGIWNPIAPSGKGWKLQDILMFPVESSINLDLNLSRAMSFINYGFVDLKLGSATTITPSYMLSETQENGVANWKENYPEDLGNIYDNNPTYSRMDTSKSYTEEPFDFDPVGYHDYLITVSDKKTTGEYTDSFLKFKFNNILEVDSRYGPIVRLINFKNNIYSLQNNGIAGIAINDRSLINAGEAGQLSLGTGGVLERYDYVTTSSGIKAHDAVIVTPQTFYYLDSAKERIYMMSNNEAPISVINGVNSYLKGRSYSFVDAGYDVDYKEVLFNIDGTILAYSELFGAFRGFDSYNPNKFINHMDQLYVIKSKNRSYSVLEIDPNSANVTSNSGNTGVNVHAISNWNVVGSSDWINVNNTSGSGDSIVTVNYNENTLTSPRSGYVTFEAEIEDNNDNIIVAIDSDYLVADDDPISLIQYTGNSIGLYKQNKGIPGLFYPNLGLDPARCSLTLIINPNGVVVDVFDNIDFRTDVRSNNKDVYDETFQTLIANNTYQSFKKKLKFSSTIKRIARVWRTHLLGDTSYNTASKRMVDTYLMLTLRYDSSGKTFKCSDIITYYRQKPV